MNEKEYIEPKEKLIVFVSIILLFMFLICIDLFLNFSFNALDPFTETEQLECKSYNDFVLEIFSDEENYEIIKTKETSIGKRHCIKWVNEN